MNNSPSRAFRLEVLGTGLVAALLFRFGLLLVLFMVPLQIGWVRRGERAGLLACAAFLGFVALLKLVDLARVAVSAPTGIPVGLAFLDLVLPIAFLAGLYIMNRPAMTVTVPAEWAGGRERSVRIGTPGKMLLSAVAGAAILAPLVWYLAGSELVDDLFSVQLALLEQLAGGFEADDAEVAALLAFTVRVFLSGFLTSFTVIVTVNWWLGIRIVKRVTWASPEPNAVAGRLLSKELSGFRLSDGYVWLLIAGWGLVALSVAIEQSVLGVVAWNVALLSTLLFGIQGLAVLWHLLEQRGLHRQARIGVGIALTFALLIPLINVMVFLGIPGLGVSEIWVNYHRFERSGNQDEGDTE